MNNAAVPSDGALPPVNVAGPPPVLQPVAATAPVVQTTEAAPAPAKKESRGWSLFGSK
jgi:hypothetical protein